MSKILWIVRLKRMSRGLSLEDIAENEGYTVRHIYRLYSEAISILAVTTQ